MKAIDDLFEKYLAGESSLQEEKTLKQFVAEHPDSEYACYYKAFSGFSSAQQEPILSADFNRNLMSKLRYTKSRKFRKLIQYSSLSVAASLLFAVGFFALTQKNEAYVIENGVRYDDMEKAVGFADEALNDAIAPLKQSMQSLKPIKGLEGALTPSFINYSEKDSGLRSSMAYDSMVLPVN